MSKFTLSAVVNLFMNGAKKAKGEVGEINDELLAAEKTAKRVNKTLAQTKVGQGAMGRAGVPDVSDTRTYRTQRGVTGARGASGRDFAAMAQGGGGTGLVAAYAEVASTLFAVTAAFMALSNAAKVDQITKGLEIMGATAGVTLKNVSKGLQEVTGFGITAADAMRTVALASSAGFSKEEIEDLGRVAKGASIALGRDLGDSMDRLIKGTVKLEPELLDELGIMVRLDDAVRDYAFANNKTASSLTQLERRQAFANAVTAEGLKKFGDLADNADPNPYDKLAASVRDLGTEILSFVNKGLKPFVEVLANVPALALLPFTYLLQSVSSKLLPTFDSAMGKAGETTEKYARKLSVIRDRSDEITGSMTAANNSLVAQGKIFSNLKVQPGMANRKSEIIGPGLVSPELSGISEKQLIKAIDEEILSIKQKLVTAEGVHTTRLTNQRDTLVSIKQKLTEIKKEHNEILRIRNQEIAAQAQLNAQTAQQGILTEFNSNVFSKGLLGATLTGLGDVWSGIIVPGMKESNKVSKTLNGTLTGTAIKFKTVGIAAATAGRLIGMAFLQAIPIIGQLVMVGTIIYSIFAAFESEASKQEKKLLENLKNINENAKEVNKQIGKAFERRDYGAGFEAAINSLGEIITALKEIENLRNKAFPDKTEEPIVSKDFFSSVKRAYNKTILDMEKDPLAPKNLPGISFGTLGVNTYNEMQKATAETSQEALAQNNALLRVQDILGKEYADSLRERIKAQENELVVLDEANAKVKGLASSWSTVGQEAIQLNKALKQYYGKPITETAYSPVIGALRNINVEVTAVQKAFKGNTEQSGKALESMYNEFSKGGAEAFGELDKLANDSTFSFLKAFNEINNLDFTIKALEQTKDFATNADYIAAIAKRAELTGIVIEKASSKQILLNATIANQKDQELQKRQGLLNLSKKQLDLEKSVAQKALDIYKTNRDIERLKATGTKEVSEAQQSQDKISDARKLADIENKGLEIRKGLIMLEFELEALKLTRAQETLNTTVTAISAFSEEGLKTGSEIAKAIYDGLENKDFKSFSKAISGGANNLFPTDFTRLLAKEKTFTEAEIDSLYSYAAGAEYTAKALGILNNVKALSLALDGLTAKQTEQVVDSVLAEAEAYTHLDNVAKRKLETDKQILENTNKRIEAQKTIRDLEEETQILLRQAKAASEGREYSSIGDDRRAFETSIGDLKKERASIIESNRIAVEKLDIALMQANKSVTDLINQGAKDEIIARAQNDAAEALRNYDAAMNDAFNALGKNTGETDKATAALINFNASLATVDSVIRDAKTQGSNDLAIAQAGMGMNLMGAGGTFKSLVEQGAKDEKYGGDISKLLANDSAMAKIRQATTDIEYMNIQAEGLNTIFSNMGAGITDAFTSMIDGSKDFKQAFGDLAISVIKDIAAMLTRMLILKTMSTLLGMPMGGAGGVAPSGDVSGTFSGIKIPSTTPGFANGGIIGLANGGVTARGLQGIVTKPTYLVGEGRYNEAVVPLPNGRSIPVQMHGGKSQNNNVAVNVNISNSGQVQSETQGQDMSNLGQAVALAVQKELLAQKMPGGILNRYGAA
jgi:hypothetical protein